MKKTYLISYDLLTPGRDYQPVYDYMATFSDKVKALYSLYLVHTTRTAGEIRDALKNKVDSNDKVLVIEISTSNWASYNLSSAVVDWLKAR